MIKEPLLERINPKGGFRTLPFIIGMLCVQIITKLLSLILLERDEIPLRYAYLLSSQILGSILAFKKKLILILMFMYDLISK